MVLLRQHLDMIGRHEPIQRKARFWQSYVRALKGTDDMKAPDATHYSRPRGIFRPLSDFPLSFPKSIYEDPIHAGDRITVPGYRYLPVSRETYGISPRNIYPHHYSSTDRFPSRPAKDVIEKEVDTDDFDRRMDEIDDLFPYEHRNPQYYRPKTQRPGGRSFSVPPRELRSRSRALSPPPPRPRAVTPAPMQTPSAYSYTGVPLHTHHLSKPLAALLEPNPYAPTTRFTRDPWWYDFPSLRPFYRSPYYYSTSPYYLRDSFLSPVKNTYLWRQHPKRPFSAHYPYFWL